MVKKFRIFILLVFIFECHGIAVDNEFVYVAPQVVDGVLVYMRGKATESESKYNLSIQMQKTVKSTAEEIYSAPKSQSLYFDLESNVLVLCHKNNSDHCILKKGRIIGNKVQWDISVEGKGLYNPAWESRTENLLYSKVCKGLYKYIKNESILLSSLAGVPHFSHVVEGKYYCFIAINENALSLRLIAFNIETGLIWDEIEIGRSLNETGKIMESGNGKIYIYKVRVEDSRLAGRRVREILEYDIKSKTIDGFNVSEIDIHPYRIIPGKDLIVGHANNELVVYDYKKSETISALNTDRVNLRSNNGNPCCYDEKNNIYFLTRDGLLHTAKSKDNWEIWDSIDLNNQ